MAEERRFTVIENKEYTEEERFLKRRVQSYHSNPIKWRSQSLKEQLARYVNDEAGPRFSVEDLLKW